MILTSVPAVTAPDVGRRATVAVVVAAAVDGVGGARRTVGLGVEVATQYPGGRVIGVRLGDASIDVHIVVEGPDVARVADDIHVEVRAALDRVGDPRAVAVTVDDIDLVSVPEGR